LLRALRNWDQVLSSFSFGEYIHVVMRDDQMDAMAIENYLKNLQFQQLEIKPIEANIEDSFMDLMNEQNG